MNIFHIKIIRCTTETEKEDYQNQQIKKSGMELTILYELYHPTGNQERK